MIALIDGDILVYRCAFAAEKTKYLVVPEEEHGFVPYYFDAHKDIPKDMRDNFPVWSRKIVEPEEHAVEATRATLRSILEQLGTSEYELYISGEHSFREDIAKTKKYKGNRDGMAKPVHYGAVRETLIGVGGIICGDGLEADDMLGIRATELGGDCIVVSIDKDLLQIPARHYNWVDRENVVVSPKEATLYLGSQILSGDPTDNVPGLPGWGQVKSRKHVQDSANTADMLARIREAYRDNGGDEYLMEQGALVYILRSRDDSFKRWYDNYAN